MFRLVAILEKLDKISTKIHYEENTIQICSEINKEVICTIDISNKKYKIYKLGDSKHYDDVFRILSWFGYRNIDDKNKSAYQCNGLGCDNCNGCAFSSLSSFYKAKITLNQYIPSRIIEEYTFIGALTISELPVPPSPFKTYIHYNSKEFSFYKAEYDSKNISWKKKISCNSLEIPLHIDQLIPEILKLESFTQELYGIFNNKAVVWKYKSSSNRSKWVFQELILSI